MSGPKLLNDGSKRYVVAYPNPVSDYPAKVSTVRGTLYWLKAEADRVAQLYGGWVIEIDLNSNKPQENSPKD